MIDRAWQYSEEVRDLGWDDTTPAFREGWRAEQDGDDVSSNPYDREQSPRDWDEWEEGWQAAKEGER